MAASILRRPSCVACPGSGRGEGAEGTSSDLLRPWSPHPDEPGGSCRPYRVGPLSQTRGWGTPAPPPLTPSPRTFPPGPRPAPEAPPPRRRAAGPCAVGRLHFAPSPPPALALPPRRRPPPARAEPQSRQRRRRRALCASVGSRAGLGPGRSRRLSGEPSAGRPGRPGRGRAGAWPGAAARRPGQHDRCQQHPQQRWAAALALAVLRALRAHPPRRGDPVLRLAAALAQSQARALHRPGGQPPAEPQEEEGGEGVGAAAHARLGGRPRGLWRAARPRGRCEGGTKGGTSRGGIGRTEGGRAQQGQSPWVARSGHGLEGEGHRRPRLRWASQTIGSLGLLAGSRTWGSPIGFRTLEGRRGCGPKGVLRGTEDELEGWRQVGCGWPLQPPGPELDSVGLGSRLCRAWAGRAACA